MTENRDLEDGKAIIATLVILGFILFIMSISYIEFLPIAIILWILLLVAIIITHGYYWSDYEGKPRVTKSKKSVKLSGYDTSSSGFTPTGSSKRYTPSPKSHSRHSAQVPLMQRTPDSIVEIVIFGMFISFFFYFVNILAGVIISIFASFAIWIRIDKNNELISEQIRHLNRQFELHHKI